jgi:hypothetical protein
MTIMGKHTIAETREHIALIKFRVKAMDKLITDNPPKPNDDAAIGSITRYTTWRMNWVKESDAVITDLTLLSLGAPLVPADTQPSEKDWVRIIVAVNKENVPSSFEPGTMKFVMEDVENRLGKKMDLSDFRANFPETSKVGDPDLEGLKKLDATIKAGEAAAKAGKEGIKTGIGAVPWYAWPIGAAVIGAVGFVYVSPFLPKPRQ